MSASLIPASESFTGKWICVAPGEKPGNSFYYFRKEFELTDTEGLFLRISADTRYRAFINGKYAGYGSLQSQPYYQYFDVREVSSLLRKGKNCIAVEVSYTGTILGTTPALLMEISDKDGNAVCASDASFRGLLSPAYDPKTAFWKMSKYRSYQEVFDAGKEPKDWKEVGFDDSRWSFCSVFSGYCGDDVPVGGIWGRMIRRDIPFMDESRTVYARSVILQEEHLDLNDRFSWANGMGINLTHLLSQPGKPVEYSRIENADALCREDGVTLLAASPNHLDHSFDGIYSPTVVLDFGRIVNAFPVLVVEGEPGAQIVMGFAERLIDGHFYDALECPFANAYTLRGGEEEIYIPFTWQAFRYVRIQLRGGVSGVKIKQFGARLTRYPYQYRGAFRSSNEKYNRLFDISRYTIELCSNECLMDTPFREQGQFLGDVCAVTLGGIYACFGDDTLPSKYLNQSAQGQVCTGLMPGVTNMIYPDHNVPYVDYTLEWIIALWEHYLYTGDEKWIHLYYPHALKAAEYFLPYLNSRGFVESTHGFPFIDWSHVDKRGEIAALNAIYYGALDAVCKMAAFKNDTYMEQMFREIREKIRAGFAAEFYDPQRRCIADGRYRGVLSENVNESAAAAALWFGLLDDALAHQLIEDMYVRKTVPFIGCEPFFTWFVLRGLAKYNRMDLAMEIVDHRYIKRMVDRGASSVYEEWGYNGSWRTGKFDGFMRTQSHAWSACPAEFFIKTLTGITILEPGGHRVQVRPCCPGFDYEVTCPLKCGNVMISCRDGKCSITADPGITVEP